MNTRRQNIVVETCYLPPAVRRLPRYGTGHHTTRNSSAIPSLGAARGLPAAMGRAGTDLALRRRRHHLRWRSIGVAQAGAAERDRAPLCCLLYRLPQGGSGRAPPVGPHNATRLWLGAGL